MTLSVVSETYADDRRIVELIQNAKPAIEQELSKVIVGQMQVVDQLLISLFSGGHCLLTGAPGLAKTLLVKSISELFHLKFQRIQFTPDLMPADITGIDILDEAEDGRREMTFVRGPVFANVVLADEINRTPPKTQAALLEAMQEKQVTASGRCYALDQPFFVLATQNPVEMEGTWPLPEAQLDRFMFNLVVDYLSEDDEVTVIQRTTAGPAQKINPLFTGPEVQRFHEVVRTVPVSESVVRYAVQLAAATRPHQDGTPAFINEYVTWGAGVRAAQNLILGAKARALLEGRVHVIPEDVRQLLIPTLRHRVLLNYRADADRMTVDDLCRQLLQTVPSS